MYAACTCDDTSGQINSCPDQCTMCGGMSDVAFDLEGDRLISTNSFPFDNVGGYCKSAGNCCEVMTICCISQIPYGEWLCSYPLGWLVSSQVERYVNK